jgi:hypothetical protein
MRVERELPMATNFIRSKCRCCGHIERLDPTVHRNCANEITALSNKARESGSLCPKYHTDTFGSKIPKIKQTAIGRVVKANNPDTLILDSRQRRWKPGHYRHRHMLNRSRSGLCNCRRDVDSSVTGNDNAISSCAFATAHDCPKISRVGHTINCDKKWGAALASRDQTRKINFGNLCRPGEHSLRGFRTCSGFKASPSYVGNRHSIRSCETDDVVECFVTLKLRRDPNLLNSAALGEQQLPNGLTALNL